MIDVLREPRLTVKQVAGQLGVSYQTVLNWITKGANGKRLEVVRVGRSIRTTPAALQRFVGGGDDISIDDHGEIRRALAERHGI